MTIDQGKQYFATLKTENGDIVIKLLDDQAPLAVNSFIFLANNGWFDNVTSLRVMPGFVAQAGDPSGTGFGGPGYAFKNETSSDLKFDAAGVVGMANSGPDSNGSQFFITYAPQPDLDGGYTVFGRVVSGMDVAESLTPRDPSQSIDLPSGDKILDVKFEEREVFQCSVSVGAVARNTLCIQMQSRTDADCITVYFHLPGDLDAVGRVGFSNPDDGQWRDV